MKINLLYIVFLLLINSFFNSNNLCAQEDDLSNSLIKKYAENSFRDKDYEFSLDNYLKLYMNEETNMTYNLRIGVCYTESNIDKTAGIPYLEFVVSHNNFQRLAYYYLGRAYMYAYRFTEAVEAFYNYKQSGVNDDVIHKCDRLIEMCYYALEIMNNPKNITFERLDSTVNSKFDDYNPYVTEDGKHLVYSSNRKYVKELESYISDIYSSKSKKSTWSESYELPINTFDNEDIVGLSADGSKLMMHVDGDYASNDIQYAFKKGSKYIKDENVLPFNTDGIERGASITSSGDTIYFSSDCDGGYGGLDIYYVTKNSFGQWSEPQNIGSNINTKYDDNYPNITSNGKKLFFSSKGHESLGDYDLFYSVLNESTKEWSNPMNLGYPINTPFDNTTISYSKDEKYAYISANRKEGFGNLDIYRISKGEGSDQTAFVLASIFVGTPSSSVPYSGDYLKVFVTLYDVFGNIYGRYNVDEGMTYMSLYPGKYKLEVRFDGAKEGYEEELTITANDANKEIEKQIYLKPVE
ncbi:MAG: PD40 domain-containing protein [Bacteroidales bacterium]|nr:PD40 domain-containing protein [Bacteroidales bacterium]